MSKAKTKGWLCPACNGGVSPHVERCPCVAVRAGKQLDYQASERLPSPIDNPLQIVPPCPWYPRWPGDVPLDGSRWEFTWDGSTGQTFDRFTIIGDAP